MKRSLNLLAVVVIVAAGVALYQLKYSTERLQNEVQALRHQITTDTAAMKVLNAEWTYLSRPDRLEALGDRYLALQPVKAGQVIASIEDLPVRADQSVVLAQVNDFRVVGPQFASNDDGEGYKPRVRPVPLPTTPRHAPADESRPILQVRNEPGDGNPAAFLQKLKFVQAGGLRAGGVHD